MFPPVPDWDGLHPLIIHFPIALLLVAPLFVILGVAVYRQSRIFFISALILMLLGTASLFIAVSTGEAAGELAERTPEVMAAIARHEDLAENTRLVFSLLTLAFAAVVFFPVIRRRAIGRMPVSIAVIVFLLLYAAGAVLLADTAHQGGLLVHKLGIRSIVAESPEIHDAGHGDQAHKE